mgnify:CR=1 FL=1
MSIEMSVTTTSKISSTGLPVYRMQFLNAETGAPVSDVDIVTAADCVRYINENPLIKDALVFKKGDKIDTDLESIINGLLYPYYAPEFINIQNTAALPEFGSYINEDITVFKEKGSAVDDFSLAVTVMAGSKTLMRCSLIKVQNNTREMIDNRSLNLSPGKSTTIDFTIPGFLDDVQYFFEISDNEEVIQSSKINYKFLLPIYIGYAKDGLLDPGLSIEEFNRYINGLIKMTDRVDKRLVEPNTPQKAFFNIVKDKELLCPFIMVPLDWTSLVKIEDVNGIDITKFFRHSSDIKIQTSTENTDLEGYKIYIAKKPVDSKAKTRYLRDITYIFASGLDWKDLASEGEQTEILTGFDVLTNGPIDSRFVKKTYDDLAYVAKPYEGLVVYVKEIKTFYKYNQDNKWEVTNNTTHLYSGIPEDTIGGSRWSSLQEGRGTSEISAQ